MEENSKDIHAIKILHVSTPLSWRGGEQQILYLMEYLQEQKVEQYLLCNENSEVSKRAREKGLNVLEQRKKSSIDLRFAKRIQTEVKRLGITHIHVHDSHAHTLTFLSGILFGNTCPVILSRKVDFPIGENWLSKKKYNSSKIKKIICVSKAIQEIISPVIAANEKITVIHDGVDLNKYALSEKGNYLRNHFSIQQDEWIIGNVSAIAPHKDYYTFVDTCEQLIQQGIHAQFFIIGSGPEEKAIRTYVNEKDLENQIHFTGFITDILPVLKELDLFLMTSQTEGFGTTLLDAMACEVPIVATKAGGIPEMMTHEKNGLLASVKDTYQLSENVLRLMKNEALRIQVMKGGLERVKDFSKEKMAEKTLRVYLEE